MTWTTWKPALALGAALATCGAVSAGDRDTMQLSGGTRGSTTMTLGGKGTAAKAATEDTELMRHGGFHGGGFHGGYHGGWGYHGGYGYRGWGGGWGGYRGYYGGYRGYYGGFYRPYYYGGFYRPYYYGGFYRPYYRGFYPYYGYGSYFPYYGYGYGLGYGGYGGYGYAGYGYGGYGYGCGSGFYIGISSGSSVIAPAPAVTSSSGSMPPMAQPTPQNGTFPYDGGPSNPVPLPMSDPQPKADPQPIPPANPPTSTINLPVSGSKTISKPTTSPYKYKAYGEK